MIYSGRKSNGLGVQAEEMFFDIFQGGLLKERMVKVMLPDNKYGAMRASREQDSKEGVDFFWGGIRFDFAICYKYSVNDDEDNFAKEGMSQKLKDIVQGYNHDLHLGVRWCSYFQKPVVVIGWSCTNIKEVCDLCHFIDSNWDKIYVKAKALKKRHEKGERI